MANVDKKKLLNYLKDKKERYDRFSYVLKEEGKLSDSLSAEMVAAVMVQLHSLVLEGEFDERIWR